MKHHGSLRTQLRRREVRRLLARGFTSMAMAERLKVSRPTIDIDIRKIRKQIREEVSIDKFGDLLIKIKENQDAVLNELWRIIEDNTSSKQVKLGALNSIIKILGEATALYQRLGVIERAPEKIEITGQDSIEKQLSIAYLEVKKLKEGKKEEVEETVLLTDNLKEEEGEIEDEEKTEIL